MWVIRKLVKEGIKALSRTEVSVAWVTVEDIFTLGPLHYETHKGGLESEEYMEGNLNGLVG